MPATEPSPAAAAEAFDADRLRARFPALAQTVYDDVPLTYLDNAATSQKPQGVLDRLERYYAQENSNVHRGVHRLSQQATDAYEGAREAIATLINAPDARQVIYTRGTTEALNIVASSFGRSVLHEGDEVIVSEMEHHSNIVPWQMACDATGASLRVIPVTDDGELEMEAFRDLLNERTRIVAITHISNALGTINPVEQIIREAHQHDVPVVIDGAQSVPHLPVDVQALDADFYAFSGHKMFGPTGIGVLYGKAEHLEQMPPYQGGGDMIDQVSFEKTTYDELPHKFEAGTPHIAGAIGLGAAAEFLQELDWDAVHRHEDDVLTYATDRLQALDGVTLIGTAREKASVLSFVLDDIHPYDAGTVLDRMGVAVRTGHHCTQPLMKRLGIPGTIRASFALYNTRADADRLVDGLEKVRQMLG
jgi:cysteine desulfurase/selenocysteine lyase